jgi:hypothetical protein
VSDFCLLLARAKDASIRVLQGQAPNRIVHADIGDLSRIGWRFSGGSPEKATAFASGRVIETRRIAVVLCRIALVTSEDLVTVHPEDRAYAASEMTAFLRAWLMQFQGVRCNEPTWMSLAGPGWHPQQWIWIVSRLGVPVIEAAVKGVARKDCETAMALVAGREVLGVVDPTLVDYSLRIARAVKARLLSLRFVRDGRWRFEAAESRPDLDEASAAALLRDLGVRAT